MRSRNRNIKPLAPGARLIAGFLAGLIISITVAGCSRSDTASAASWTPDQAAEVIAVEAVTTVPGKLYRSIEASGSLAGANEAWVVAEAAGVVQEVAVRLGDRVGEGTVLALLDSSIARLSMEQARAAWEKSKIDLDATTALNQRGSASRTELARAQSAERGARAAYEQAVKQLEDRSVSSPIAGTIAWIDQRLTRGNYLTPGIRLVRVVDDSTFRIDLDLGERQVGLIDVGAAVSVTIPAADATKLSGRVAAIAGGSDPDTASYRVVVTLIPSDGLILLSGMSVSVALETSREGEALLMPTAALLSEGSVNAVFVAEDGRARLREVRLGRRLGGSVEVLEGIEEGQAVVVSGTSRLSDGATVQAALIGTSGDWK